MAIITVLRQSDIFYGLSAGQLEAIAAICEQHTYQAGEVLFEENSSSDELYIIAQGEIEIQVNPDVIGDTALVGPQTIATLRRGQSFGEIALVDEGLRSAAASCAQNDTHLVVLRRQKLMDLCDDQPRLGYLLMRNLAADLAMKIRNTDLQVREHITWGRQQSSS